MTEQTRKRLAAGRSLGGRPTMYKPEFCEQIIEFFCVEPFRDVEVTRVLANGQVRAETKRQANLLPTLTRFAESIGVALRTAEGWIDEKCGAYQPDFAQAWARAKAKQKDFLIQNGLQGLYPPASYIFTATNITDMRNRTDVEHSGAIATLSEPTPEEWAAFQASQQAAKSEKVQ